MSGLNIKVTAFMLVNILVVQGKIYQEDRYLMDFNHIERYRRLYSDNDRSDVFDNTDSKLNFDAPNLNIEDLRRGLPNVIPASMGDNNGPILQEPLHRNFDVGMGMPNIYPVEDSTPDFEDPRQRVHNMFPGTEDGSNMLDQDTKPDWFPNNVDNEVHLKPSWVPGRITGGMNNYPTRRPGNDGMKRKCQNIKGLPTPDSGCCGVQVTRRPSAYPNNPWYPGGRFSRSADKDILPNKMIRGGKATDLHQFPWMIHLIIDTRVSGIGSLKSCGGTLISSRYVLTAAHCLYDTYKNNNQLKVILAEYNTKTSPKDCNGRGCIRNQERGVELVVLHPDFNHTHLQNDVALLRLSSDAGYTDFIRPACLPTEDIADLSDEPLIIAGWGLDGTIESDLKQSAVVNYVSDDKCQANYSYKDDSIFCSIGGNGEDVCHGDSGGPLMVQSNGKYFLSGVVNGKRSDKECGSTEVPSLFNNVYYHLNWIKSNVQD